MLLSSSLNVHTNGELINYYVYHNVLICCVSHVPVIIDSHTHYIATPILVAGIPQTIRSLKKNSTMIP